MDAADDAPSPAEALSARRLRARARAEGLAASDFELLQHAIVARGDTGKALRRMRRLADLRARYRTEELEPAAVLAAVRAYADSGFLLGAGSDEEGRGYLLVDYAAFNPAELDCEEKWRLHVAASLLVLDAVAGDSLRTMRSGAVIVADCYNSGWRNFSAATQRSFIELYQQTYPTTIAGLAIVDAPVVVRTFISLCRGMLTRKMMAKIRQVPKHDLPTVLPLPSTKLPLAFGGDVGSADVVMSLKDRLAARSLACQGVVV